MPISTFSNRRRLLTAFCLALLAAIFITNPMTTLVARGQAASPEVIAMRGFSAPIHMACLIGAVFAIMQLLRPKADRTGLVGGTLAILGWAVGLRIMGLGQLEALLASGITGMPADTLRKMFEAAPIVWVSIVPLGLLFPIGLMTLGIALAVTNRIPRWIGVALALGGLLFPIGRIPAILSVYITTDLLLGVAFGAIAWQVYTRPELWSVEEAPLAHHEELHGGVPSAIEVAR